MLHELQIRLEVVCRSSLRFMAAARSPDAAASGTSGTTAVARTPIISKIGKFETCDVIAERVGPKASGRILQNWIYEQYAVNPDKLVYTTYTLEEVEEIHMLVSDPQFLQRKNDFTEPM